MPEPVFTALTNEQLGSLEERFSIRLPVDYRQFMQNYPCQLTTVGVEGGATIAELQVVTSYERLIELNASIRSPDLWYFGEHPWPNQFFVIGSDGYGDHYFLDTSGENPGVRFQDCYNWDVGYVADSLESFVRLLVEGPPIEDEED